MPEYDLLVTAPAQRALDRLPERVAAAIAELLTGDLLAAPRRVGKPLRRELAGIWSARRGSYRVLYEIDETEQRVVVLRIDHRADIYRPYR
jgi:mRNA-degrading endonuclease RelE of RelBE toxin-antitoxin system